LANRLLSNFSSELEFIRNQHFFFGKALITRVVKTEVAIVLLLKQTKPLWEGSETFSTIPKVICRVLLDEVFLLHEDLFLIESVLSDFESLLEFIVKD